MRSIEESLETLEILQLMSDYYIALQKATSIGEEIQKKIKAQERHKAAVEGRN